MDSTNLKNRMIAIVMRDLQLSVTLKGVTFENLSEDQTKQADEIMVKSVELKDRIKKLEKDLEEKS